MKIRRIDNINKSMLYLNLALKSSDNQNNQNQQRQQQEEQKKNFGEMLETEKAKLDISRRK